MKVSSVATSLFVTVGFIQTAMGLYCYESCSACWSDTQPGVDIKILCDYVSNECGQPCPSGYHGKHCAKRQRCMYVETWKVVSSGLTFSNLDVTLVKIAVGLVPVCAES